jgi:anti-sigma B factor antagonist
MGARDYHMGNNDIVPGFDDEANEGLIIELIKAQNIDRGLVISITGEISMWTYQCFLKRINKAIQAGYCRLILVGLRYIGTSASGTLMEIRKRVRAMGGDFVIVGFPEKKFIENLYGPIFALLDTLDDAAQFFGR